MKSQSIYQTFCNKLPANTQELLPDGDTNKLVTFLNPYTLLINSQRSDLFDKFDYIGSDGILPVILLKTFGRVVKPRISFDMSSLAPMVFSYACENQKKLYLIGTTQDNIENFTNLITKEYPNIQIAGVSSGFFDDKSEKIEQVKSTGADIVIIGMGSPLQDQFAVMMREQNFLGSIYTCGGFFHQTTEKVNYYPAWVNNLHLRFLYRIYKEPYVLKRLLRYYPVFVFTFTRFCLKSINKSK